MARKEVKGVEKSNKGGKRRLTEALRPKVGELAELGHEDPNPVFLISAEGRVLYHNKASVPLLKEMVTGAGKRLSGRWRRHISDVLDSELTQEAELTCGDRVFSLTFVPIGDSDRVNVYGLDITLHKQAEENALRERDNLTKILDAMEDGVYIVDRNYEIQYVNPSLIEDFGAVEGRKCYEYFHGCKEVCSWCKYDHILAGESVRWEWHSVKNGKTYDLLGTPIRNADGSISKLEIFRDITERKRSEEELQRLMEKLEGTNKELERVVYVASHELRSPLLTVHGFSGQLADIYQRLKELLEKGGDLETVKPEVMNLIKKEIPEALSFINAGTMKMQIIINGLLRVSRIGTAAINVEPLDVNEMMKQVMDTMSYEIKNSGAFLKVETMPECMGDAAQINQVFSNLLDNAVKYLHPGRKGEIQVCGDVEKGMSIYRVKDNGQGIAEEHQEKVFEIFHRVEPDSDVPGEGLGLSIVSRILEQHDGKIWMESEPGKGTTFFVALPTP